MSAWKFTSIVLMPVIFPVSKTMQFQFPIDGYQRHYIYADPASYRKFESASELKDKRELPFLSSINDLAAVGEVEGCEPIPGLPTTECVTAAPPTTTTCVPGQHVPGQPVPGQPVPGQHGQAPHDQAPHDQTHQDQPPHDQAVPLPEPLPAPDGGGDGGMNIPQQEVDQKAHELRVLVQHLYVAQARVQLEASEIRKAQAVANTAQQQLEEASNQVRTITATLQNAQQEVAAAAIRAQIAQLQLAAHDQLLFAARQDVDALSSQMVGLQAAEGIVQPKMSVDLNALLNKLRQPLASYDKPTPVPTIVTLPPQFKKPSLESNSEQPTGGGDENSHPNDGGEGVSSNNQESENNDEFDVSQLNYD